MFVILPVGYGEPVKRFKWNSHDYISVILCYYISVISCYISVLKHNSNTTVKSECRGDRDHEKINYLRNYWNISCENRVPELETSHE